MDSVIDVIKTRRSIRRFADQSIDDGLIAQIVECGRCAPNAWGHQGFEFYVVTNQSVIDSLTELSAKYLDGEREKFCFFGARLLILIADRRDNFMRLADAGCAMENMFIAAASMGIGSVWINQLSPISDKIDVIDMLETIGITKDKVVTSVGAFGYPDEIPTVKQLISKVSYIK